MNLEVFGAVVLLEDFPDEGVRHGDVGYVLELYEDSKAVEVEFSAIDGRTVALFAIEPKRLRLRRPGEPTGVRAIGEGMKIMNVVEVDRGPRVV